MINITEGLSSFHTGFVGFYQLALLNVEPDCEMCHYAELVSRWNC